MRKRLRPLCPSAQLGTTSKVFGVVTQGGQVAYLDNATQVDDNFIQLAKRGRDPDRRFRIAAPCMARSCANWAGRGCGLPKRVMADLAETQLGDRPLPSCAIREACVWYAQVGSEVCFSCRFVVTRADDRTGRQETGRAE